jgi:hypothetical protein
MECKTRRTQTETYKDDLILKNCLIMYNTFPVNHAETIIIQK